MLKILPKKQVVIISPEHVSAFKQVQMFLNIDVYFWHFIQIF